MGVHARATLSSEHAESEMSQSRSLLPATKPTCQFFIRSRTMTLRSECFVAHAPREMTASFRSRSDRDSDLSSVGIAALATTPQLPALLFFLGVAAAFRS